MRFFYLLAGILIPLLGYAVDDFDRQQTEKRIQPLGKVHVEQAQPSKAAVAAPEIKPASEPVASGKSIYERYCVICHNNGLAGAPKFQNAAEWKPRLQKGMDTLMQSVVNGLNAMPPKGTCVECSDADFKAAIEYMVPKS